jgi:2'-5' RNA ligase
LTERLFFALWPGEAERAGLAGLQRSLLPHAGRATCPEDLHLTLAFLGEVALDRRACCEDAAGSVQTPPFVLRLDYVAYWPHPQVLWCGARTIPPPLAALVLSLTQALRPCGFPGERRPYTAHVTLARKVRAFDSLATPAARDWYLDWPIKGFVLAANRPGPPPRYQVLRRWACTTASPECPLCDNAPLSARAGGGD